MKDLSESTAPQATLACHGWTLVSAAPGKLGLPRPERRLVLFLPNSSAETYMYPANQRGRKGTEKCTLDLYARG